MIEDDPDRRMKLCEWALRKFRKEPNISDKRLFTNEENFYVNGEVNVKTYNIGVTDNPH